MVRKNMSKNFCSLAQNRTGDQQVAHPEELMNEDPKRDHL